MRYLKGGLDPALKPAGDDEQQGQRYEGDERQLPVEREHAAEGHEDGQYV